MEASLKTFATALQSIVKRHDKGRA